MIDSRSSDFDEKELYELDSDQATELLREFLRTEKEALESMELAFANEKYSRDSVVEFFEYVISNKFDPKHIDSQDNRIWILRIAFYFGESLKKQSRQLDWGIGKRDTAFENHPVITGFPKGIEAALITIVRNTLLGVVIDGAARDSIRDAVDYWFDAGRASTST